MPYYCDYCLFQTGKSFPHAIKDCHRLAKDNDKGNSGYRYDKTTNPASRKPYYPPPPAAPATAAAVDFEPYKQPNRVVALHVTHGQPTKMKHAAETYFQQEMYAPYAMKLTETKPYLPHKAMDVTYTDVVKKKMPYIKYDKPYKSDVIDLTGVNVNGTKEVIFKTEDFMVDVDIDELSKEFDMEKEICNLGASVKEHTTSVNAIDFTINKRLDTIETTLVHGGGSNTIQMNAINSINGVVTVMQKVMTETYTKAEETQRHVLVAIATINAARRENTKALNKVNKMLSDSSDTVFSEQAQVEIKSCGEFAFVAQAHKINDAQKEVKAKLAEEKILKRNKKAREQYKVKKKEEQKPNEKRSRNHVYDVAAGESASPPSPPSLTEIDMLNPSAIKLKVPKRTKAPAGHAKALAARAPVVEQGTSSPTTNAALRLHQATGETPPPSSVTVIVDSGATIHLFGQREHFQTLRDVSQTLSAVGGDDLTVTGIGTVHLLTPHPDGTMTTLILNNVYYVPESSFNLLSVGQAEDSGIHTNFRERTLTNANGQVVATMSRTSGEYVLQDARAIHAPQHAHAVNRTSIRLAAKRLPVQPNEDTLIRLRHRMRCPHQGQTGEKCLHFSAYARPIVTVIVCLYLLYSKISKASYKRRLTWSCSLQQRTITSPPLQ
jgi:hypothetical protein